MHELAGTPDNSKYTINSTSLHQDYHNQSFLHRTPDDKDSMLVHLGLQACPGRLMGETSNV